MQSMCITVSRKKKIWISLLAMTLLYTHSSDTLWVRDRVASVDSVSSIVHFLWFGFIFQCYCILKAEFVTSSVVMGKLEHI